MVNMRHRTCRQAGCTTEVRELRRSLCALMLLGCYARSMLALLRAPRAGWHPCFSAGEVQSGAGCAPAFAALRSFLPANSAISGNASLVVAIWLAILAKHSVCTYCQVMGRFMRATAGHAASQTVQAKHSQPGGAGGKVLRRAQAAGICRFETRHEESTK